MNSFVLIVLFFSETDSKPIRIHPVQKMTQKPPVDPVTGTVSGKYKVREEYMQRSTVAKEDVRESVTDPFCGIRIMYVLKIILECYQICKKCL